MVYSDFVYSEIVFYILTAGSINISVSEHSCLSVAVRQSSIKEMTRRLISNVPENLRAVSVYLSLTGGLRMLRPGCLLRR